MTIESTYVSGDTVPQMAWNTRRIGLLGGTFNPIHCGHLEMAKAALQEFALDQVWVIPSRIPPHKLDPFIASEHDRWRMVEIACAGEEQLVPCDIEMRRSGATYTVDTLRELSLSRDKSFSFIIGSDTLLQLETWKSPQAVFDLCDFVVFMREGVDAKQVADKTVQLKERYGARITHGKHRCIEVSSTQIREFIQNGMPLDGLVPKAVEAYIWEHGVYRGQN